jgi:hypothetical protein
MPVVAAARGTQLPNPPHLRISVSQDIINSACRADSSHCMIADAVRDCCPWARNITVDIQTIRLSDPEHGVRYTYLTPRQAQLALLDFDAGVPAEPFSFTLVRRSGHSQWMRRKEPKTITDNQREAVRGNLVKARQYNPRTLAVKPNGDHDTVTVQGGQSTPVGALAAGVTGRKRDDGDVPTARRRRFGLRGMDAQARRQVSPE